MVKLITELEPEEILDNIHNYINKLGLVLKEEKRKIADEKMTLILKDGLIQELLDNNKNNKTFDDSTIDETNKLEEVELIILKFYYAIYNDNIELYRRLLNEKVSLGESINDNQIYLLNKELTNIFKNDKEYFDFIKVFSPSIKRFYDSIGNKDTEERDNYIISFINIIRKDKRYLYRKKNDYPPIYLDLLNARNIKVFGEDFLKNATYKQKEIINSFKYNISDENLEKIKFLIKKYPNYELICPLNEKFIESFTIDEIANMPANQTKILNIAVKEEIVPQVMEVFKIKPEFDCPVKMINKLAFTEIPTDKIVLLSEKSKKTICKYTKKEEFRKNIDKIIYKDSHNLKDEIKKKLFPKKSNKLKEEKKKNKLFSKKENKPKEKKQSNKVIKLKTKLFSKKEKKPKK